MAKDLWAGLGKFCVDRNSPFRTTSCLDDDDNIVFLINIDKYKIIIALQLSIILLGNILFHHKIKSVLIMFLLEVDHGRLAI